jgi:hypothetical protein
MSRTWHIMLAFALLLVSIGQLYGHGNEVLAGAVMGMAVITLDEIGSAGRARLVSAYRSSLPWLAGGSLITGCTAFCAFVLAWWFVLPVIGLLWMFGVLR